MDGEQEGDTGMVWSGPLMWPALCSVPNRPSAGKAARPTEQVRRLSPGKGLDSPGSRPGPLAPSHIDAPENSPLSPWVQGSCLGAGQMRAGLKNIKL